MESTEKDIELIEKEKQEYLDGELDESDDEETEEKEVDVIEINLDEKEINEWISKLEELRENKGQVSLEIDDDSELQINYEEEGEDLE